MKSGKAALLLPALFLLIVVGKVLFLLEARQYPLFQHPMVDAQVYADLARRIADGKGYPFPVFATNPFYPYFLGLFYRLFGASVLPVVLFQMALGLGSLVLIYRIARRFGGTGVALVALLLAGFYRPLNFFEIFLLPTTAGVFVNLALVALFMRFADRRSSPIAFAAGLLLGVGTLVQGNLLLLLPIMIAWIAWLERSRRMVLPAALLTAGFLIAIAPVTWRNWDHGGDRVLVSAHGGVNFYMGNNEKATGVFSFPEGVLLTPENINVYDSKRIAEKALGLRLKPSEVSRYWFRRGLNWIISDPGGWLKLVGRKTFLLWNDYEIPDNADLYFYQEKLRALRLMPFVFGLVGPLGIVGLIVLARRKRGAVIFLFLLAQLASALIFYTHSRYRIPFAVVLIPPAAVGVIALVRGFREWGAARRLWTIAGVGLLVVLVNYDPFPAGRSSARAFSLTHLANGLVEIERGEEAEETYRDASALLPDHASALYGLGRLYHGQGRYDEAVEMNRAAVRAIPTFAEAYLNLGVSLRARYEDERAAVEFREAIRLRPDWAAPRYNLGNALYDLERYGEAIEQYRRACELEPGNPLFVRNLCNACAASGDLEGAEAALRDALVRIGERDDLRNRLGDILERQGRIEEALAEYRRAVAINPRHSGAICNIGLVQYHRGEIREAIATWRAILAYDPGSPIVRNIEMAEAALAGETENEEP